MVKTATLPTRPEEIISFRNSNTAATAPKIPEIISVAIPAAVHPSIPDPVFGESMPDMLALAKSAHLCTQIPPSIPDLAQAEPMDMLTTAEYVLSTPISLITLP